MAEQGAGGWAVVIMAGTRANHPARGRERPALALCRELAKMVPEQLGGRLRDVLVCAQADDVHTQEVAAALVEALDRMKLGRGRLRATVITLEPAPGASPHRMDTWDAAVRAWLSRHMPRGASRLSLPRGGEGVHTLPAKLIIASHTGAPAACAAWLGELALRDGVQLAHAYVDDGVTHLVAASPVSARIHAQLEMLRWLPRPATVLLLGETGTGKTTTARRLHKLWCGDDDSDSPLVHINAATLSRERATSELFGHVKGAYTGAERAREGAMSRAAGGTLFLDEFGELDEVVQAQLLTALEVDRRSFRRVFRPLGAPDASETDAHVILGTNRALDAMSQQGVFRHDLLARVGTHRVELEPLSARRHEIVPAFCKQLDAMHDRLRADTRFARLDGIMLSRDAAHLLARAAYDARVRWHGNLRDVRDLAERAVLLALTQEGGVFEVARGRRAEAHAPVTLRLSADHITAALALLARGDDEGLREEGVQPPSSDDSWLSPAWAERLRARRGGAQVRERSVLEQIEAAMLLDALEQAEGNMSAAWGFLVDRRLIAHGDPKNPSDAFLRRWRRLFGARP